MLSKKIFIVYVVGYIIQIINLENMYILLENSTKIIETINKRYYKKTSQFQRDIILFFN